MATQLADTLWLTGLSTVYIGAGLGERAGVSTFTRFSLEATNVRKMTYILNKLYGTYLLKYLN